MDHLTQANQRQIEMLDSLSQANEQLEQLE